MNKKRTGIFIALMLLLAGLCSSAQAAIKDFNGSQTTATAWTTALDWDGGVIPVNDLITDTARFNKTSYANQLSHTGYQLYGIIFGDGATVTADITLTTAGASGQQLRVGAGGIVMNANSGNATFTKLAMAQDLTITNNSTSLLSIGTFGNYKTIGTTVTGTLAGTGRITFTGVVSDQPTATGETGKAALNVAGATVTLNGANTYSGTTTISSGTLHVGSGGTTGTLGAGNVVNNSALVINRSNAITVTNVISGSGTLTKSGAGTTTLTAANSYSGGTTISNGILVAAADGALGTSNVTVAAGAALTLQGGVSNDYINDSSTLILNSTSVLNLNFSGTDTVGGVSLDGGATMLPVGTYTATQLSASGTGSGSLKVVSAKANVLQLFLLTSMR